MLRDAGAPLAEDPSFDPHRAPLFVPKDGWKAHGKPMKFSPNDDPTRHASTPAQNVVCKCERVTEQEVIDACRRSLPVDSTQAMRKRTRAGMGHCQGDPENYDCETRVANIIARETGLPLSAVGRRPWPATSMLPGRWPTDAQKKMIDSLGEENATK